MAIKKSNIIKISLGIITIFLLVSFYGYHTISTRYDTLLEESNTENKLLQNQFDEILNKYDSLNYMVEKEEAKEIEKAIKEALEDSKNFSTYDNKIIVDDKSIESQINSLKVEIQEDSNEIIDINKKVLKNKKILNQLESISSTGYKTKYDKLAAINVNARGVKILSDLYSKSSSRKIQQIRVCFTLEGNEFVKYGKKDLYIQIVNPKHQIISTENSFVELDDVKLMFSEKTEALYNQKDVDVCAYVDLESKKTIKGKYIINIYNSFSKIGSTIFEYE